MAFILLIVEDRAIIKTAEEAEELGRDFNQHLAERFNEFLLTTDPTLAPVKTTVAEAPKSEQQQTVEQLLALARVREGKFTFKDLIEGFEPLVGAETKEVTKYAGLFAKAAKEPSSGLTNLGKDGAKGPTLYRAALPAGS